MIDSKDLRIGNIVLDENNKPIIIDYNYMANLLKYANWDDLKPIKLTPDILEQIGFKKPQPEHLILKTDTHEYLFCLDYEGANLCIDGKDAFCVYLHDLQNNYYFNNNKQELPININTLKV